MFCGCLQPQLPSAPYENDKMLSPSKPRHNEPQSFVNTSNKDAMANLVDLEEIVLNWARLIFDTTKSKAEAKIKKKYLCYNINWTKLFQESMEPEYGYQGAKGNVSAPKEEKVLFKTTFTNTTQREQEYSFKTERCTRSTSTVIIEKGVCRGMEVALKLKTPCEVVEANAGFHQEVQLNHIGENTNEEELCWGVDSCVRVPPSCETVAELVILEEQCRRDFRIENRMSGKVLVTVTNLKLNNSLVTVIEGNIADIIRGMPNYAAKGFTIEGNIVKYETKGTCIFRYGVEQKVKINETALRSYYK
ncbi:hypothetical protein Y032_0274g1016 [Ancylostoma ceylanicum]|uniref:Uncharacterized protein n=1 Tax=Ancylostoma ceylanicum TaxID=53326 RepID=A0A016S8C3_9BILA|nr:hypothetical protein Y032_0274g1016 [Ancylostoma ceylanicum]